jgi:large subunit ribosomal protein L31
MKAEIHPDYHAVTIRCSCGNTIETRSTLADDINVDVCSACHPFYTGTQKVRDSGGQIDKFKQRFGALSSGKKKSES